ncbi:uncharacterized protein LOC107983594 [Anolis carolinensis]|uniref:uncharacterized protein LOC107983594 n=1 Tax=Anolis carolinensis TaxID=28377 RepID=UPI002F2B72BF
MVGVAVQKTCHIKAKLSALSWIQREKNMEGRPSRVSGERPEKGKQAGRLEEGWVCIAARKEPWVLPLRREKLAWRLEVPRWPHTREWHGGPGNARGDEASRRMPLRKKSQRHEFPKKPLLEEKPDQEEEDTAHIRPKQNTAGSPL